MKTSLSKGKKKRKQLARRIKHYEQVMLRLPGSSTGFRKPGSLTK